MPNQSASWPGGRTYVFHGTVGEDATAGTHVSSLTVTPGAGNEVQCRYGQILSGATATAQSGDIWVTDGTNVLANFMTPSFALGNAGRTTFPDTKASAANSNGYPQDAGLLISGAMTLVLRVATVAVSVVQTFAVVLRVWGDAPTFTLADSVGTPTLTTNTSGFF